MGVCKQLGSNVKLDYWTYLLNISAGGYILYHHIFFLFPYPDFPVFSLPCFTVAQKGGKKKSKQGQGKKNWVMKTPKMATKPCKKSPRQQEKREKKKI